MSQEQLRAPNLGVLIPQLIQAFDQDVAEHNDLIDLVNSLEKANLDLSIKLAKATEENLSLSEVNIEITSKLDALVKGTEQVKKNAEDHMVMLKQALREKDQVTDKHDQAILTIASYKQLGSPKKIRDQIKSYKDKAAVNQKTINTLKGDIKDYRRDILNKDKEINELGLGLTHAAMTTLWSENGEHLMLFPAKLTMSVEGRAEKQVTLLYMTNSGCGKLIGIDELGEPLVCKSPAGGLRPKKGTLDKAGEILRKMRKQGWKLSTKDIEMIKD